MSLTLNEPTEDDIRFVALNMRDRDHDEFSALSPATTRDELAELLVQRFTGRGTICASYALAGPVAIGAVVETRPHVMSLLFFATDKFPSIAAPLTRFIVQRLFPPLVAAGVHRIEAVALEGYEETRRWLGVLGLRPETEPLRNYGKNKEAFRLYSWVADVR